MKGNRLGKQLLFFEKKNQKISTNLYLTKKEARLLKLKYI